MAFPCTHSSSAVKGTAIGEHHGRRLLPKPVCVARVCHAVTRTVLVEDVPVSPDCSAAVVTVGTEPSISEVGVTVEAVLCDTGSVVLAVTSLPVVFFVQAAVTTINSNATPMANTRFATSFLPFPLSPSQRKRNRWLGRWCTCEQRSFNVTRPRITKPHWNHSPTSSVNI